MLNFDLFLLPNLFPRRLRKQHKDYGSELTISVLKGILVIIRCVLYIFRKEISKRRGGSYCLIGTELQLGKMRKLWRWMVGIVAQQCECA